MRRILFQIVALVPFTDEFLSTIRRASSVLLPASIADYHGQRREDFLVSSACIKHTEGLGRSGTLTTSFLPEIIRPGKSQISISKDYYTYDLSPHSR